MKTITIRTLAVGLMASCAHSVLAQEAAYGPAAPKPVAEAPAPAAAAEPSGVNVTEIVVTAQKRSESVNKVGMSITALSGDTLARQGVQQVSDLGKVAVGFNFAQTQFGTPVYSIRGIGFYETSLTATPAVTVYTDEVALPYPQMTRFSGFDVDRVEILKGPQGTLFGQNATGGAVNYIAAKPTAAFQAGLDADYGRFNTGDVSGFVSGPIADTLSARLAIKTIQGGDWQQSYTTGEQRGQKDVFQGRLTTDWRPTDWLKSELTVSGWRDASDTTAYQLVSHTTPLPALADPAFLVYPLAPHDDRAADWTPGQPTARNDSFYQVALRNEVRLADGLQLTAITAYSHISIDAPIDSDGTTLPIYQLTQTGTTSSLAQELRLAGQFAGRGHWILGGNYGFDTSVQRDYDIDPASVVAHVFGPQFNTDNYIFYDTDKVQTYAVFANADLPVTRQLTAQAGIRYTEVKREFTGCTSSTLQDGPLGTSAGVTSFLNFLRGPLGEAPISIAPGQCATFDPVTFTPGLAKGHLDEDNVSWRTGLNYELTPSALLYLNVSKGYKAGTFANIGATVSSQYTPAKQESVLAYESGFKLALFERRVQFNAAGFYYDYDNKQLRGSVLDPILGSLAKLVNIPHSHVVGAEVQITAQPFQGLHLSGGATYVQSRVDGNFENYTPYGDPDNFRGQSFPYTPNWQANVDAQYAFPITDSLRGFVGGSVQYQGETTTAFGDLPIFRIPAYALLDLRAGLESPSARWRVTLWGRNVLDKFYYTSVTYVPTADTVASTGMPATYGASLSYRF